MKIEEVIVFLSQFNQKAEFKVAKPDGTLTDIYINDFGWNSGGEGGTKMNAVEVCIMLNDSESGD